MGRTKAVKRTKRNRIRASIAAVFLGIAALAVWQWPTVARWAIVRIAASSAQVELSFGHMILAGDRAVFDDVRVRSFRGEPIARIARLSIAYNLRDLLPGGQRLLGLETIDVDSPQLTIIRRPDGSYNVPLPKLQANNGVNQPPLIAFTHVGNGSIEIIDESRDADPLARHLYVENANVVAEISMAAKSRYVAGFDYGEQPGRLYPVRGRGQTDARNGFIDQHWTAVGLPIAGAVNFVVNSPSMRLRAGMLRGVDARYFALAAGDETLRPHLSAGGFLQGGRIAIAGLAKPVDDVRGRVDVYDDGLLTSRLDANLAGMPAQISGGIYGLRNPRLRLGIRGNGDLARLRNAFTQAQRLPLRGRLDFALLVEGTAATPLTWIALRSPHTDYGSVPLDRLDGLIAFDGRGAAVVHFGAQYNGTRLTARGRVALQKQPGAIEMLVGVQTPPDPLPYTNELLPKMSFDGVALATADDPKAIALRGVLAGTSPTERLDAVFNVDSRGSGSIGPLLVRGDRGSLYARIALDRPRDVSLALVEARDFPIPQVGATMNATLFGSETKGTIGGVAFGRLRAPQNGEASFGATIAGTPRSPRVAGTMVVAGGRYRHFAVNGNAGVAFANGTLQIHDTAVAVGPAFVGVSGTVGGLTPGGRLAPRYDLAAQLHSSDASELLAATQPRVADLVAGSIDADVHVGGAGSAPLVAGNVGAPEGSVNGLAFRDLHAVMRGDPQGVTLRAGHVVVGSTSIAFSGDTAGTAAHVAVDAPRTDLADFNDFFDTGDTFAGTGRLALAATLDGRQLAASSGDARFSNARFRRIELGDVAARWHSAGSSVVSNLAMGGPSGEIRVAGSIAPAAMVANLHATARHVDLGRWLPMLGYNVPIGGRLDADTTLSGHYPDLAMNVHAAVFGGTAGRLQIQRFELDASAVHGRGTIRSAILDVPSLSTVASGTFGLRADDPLALAVHSTSPNLGSFVNKATGKDLPFSAAFDSTLQIHGTRAQPNLTDVVALQTVRYGNLTIPRIAGEIGADRRAVTLRNGEIDLQHGKALLSAAMPIRFTPSLMAGSGPISASLAADDVDLSNVAALLPKGTQLSGRIDGVVTASGTFNAPSLNGSLTLRDGAFRGPIEREPITGAQAVIAFAGTSASLQAHAFAGGGPLTAQGSAPLVNLRRPADVAFALQVRAENARLNLPDYFRGTLNAAVSIERTARSAPQIGGNVALSSARIPLDAFLNQKAAGNGQPSLPPISFSNLEIVADRDVRLQSQNIDIGATGGVRLGGTLSAPTLDGSFRSTGGSLSFYRSFAIERGTVRFDPSSGIVPDVDAVATTFVADPATAIRLQVTGRATNLNLALASDPSYSRQQILGLLLGAQQFGAVAGVRSTGGGNFSAGSAAQTLAAGQLNTVFTRNLLEPLSASLAGALGFTAVQLTSDIQTGLGVNAVKAFGKNVSASFSQTFGYPRSQSITLNAQPSVATGLRLTAYSSEGPTLFALQQPQPIGLDVLNLNPMTSFQPLSGSNGVSFSFLRKFP
jgi:autotransporter translocation and assembly factor TamB